MQIWTYFEGEYEENYKYVGQNEVNEQYGTDYHIPVLHLAQLYGLAMGLNADELTFSAQQQSAEPILKKLGM